MIFLDLDYNLNRIFYLKFLSLKIKKIIMKDFYF